MKTLKKAAGLLLCTLLAASFTACGTGTAPTGGGSASTPSSASTASAASTASDTQTAALDYSDPAQISAEVIKPSFFLTSDGYDGSEIIWQTIKEYTNIEFQVIPVPLASYKEKEATTLASGNLPDIMGCRSYTTVDKYGPQGAFLNLEPYIEKGMLPNYIKILGEKPPAMTLATSPDGNRYGAPRIYMTPRMDEALLCRVDIFEKNGLTREPETFDEFYDILAKLKEAYPDSTPYFSRWETTHLLQNMGWMMDTNYTYYLAAGADQYVFGPDSQNYRDCLSFLQKLYANGLLDKDFATLSDEEYEEKLITNKGFVTFDYQDTSFYESSKSLMDADWNWGAMLAPKYEGKRAGYPVLEGYYGYTKAISNQSKYKDELVRFIDWTYSDPGQQALMFGIEGDTYEKTDDGSVKLLKDIKYAGNEAGTILVHGLNDQNIFSVLPGNAAEFYENVGQFTIAQKKYLTENDAFSDPIFYARFYDDAKQKQYNDIKTAVETYILEESTKVIQGQASVDNWGEVLNVAKTTYRADEGLALLNEAYDETFKK